MVNNKNIVIKKLMGKSIYYFFHSINITKVINYDQNYPISNSNSIRLVTVRNLRRLQYSRDCQQGR